MPSLLVPMCLCVLLPGPTAPATSSANRRQTAFQPGHVPQTNHRPSGPGNASPRPPDVASACPRPIPTTQIPLCICPPVWAHLTPKLCSPPASLKLPVTGGLSCLPGNCGPGRPPELSPLPTTSGQQPRLLLRGLDPSIGGGAPLPTSLLPSAVRLLGLPQRYHTLGVSSTEIHFRTNPQVRKPRSRCKQLRWLRGLSPCPTDGGLPPRHVPMVFPVSLPPWHLSLCMSSSPLLRTPADWNGAHPDSLILMYSPPQGPYLQTVTTGRQDVSIHMGVRGAHNLAHNTSGLSCIRLKHR